MEVEALNFALGSDFSPLTKNWSFTTWRERSTLCHCLPLSFLNWTSSCPIPGTYLVSSCYIFTLYLNLKYFRGIVLVWGYQDMKQTNNVNRLASVIPCEASCTCRIEIWACFCCFWLSVYFARWPELYIIHCSVWYIILLASVGRNLFVFPYFLLLNLMKVTWRGRVTSSANERGILWTNSAPVVGTGNPVAETNY